MDAAIGVTPSLYEAEGIPLAAPRKLPPEEGLRPSGKGCGLAALSCREVAFQFQRDQFVEATLGDVGDANLDVGEPAPGEYSSMTAGLSENLAGGSVKRARGVLDAVISVDHERLTGSFLIPTKPTIG